MTKVFYAIYISENVIDLGFTRKLIVYNKKLEQTTLYTYVEPPRIYLQSFWDN